MSHRYNLFAINCQKILILLKYFQLIKSEPFAVNKNIILFNGTNKDDMKDPTRVGLIAAKEYKVASPLEIYTKSEVRSLAKEMNLFNHNYAASPCLRSRLALGCNICYLVIIIIM